MDKAASIDLGAQLREVRHACAFFSDDEEAYRVLLPFITDGFAQGHKAVHIVRPDREARHLLRLTRAGIDVDSCCASGQLEVRRNTETYLVDGRFDGDRMLAAFEAMASGNAGDGFATRRIVCDMDWAPGERPHLDDLIVFEARVNDVWRRHPDLVICAYDIRTLSGEMMIDIMRTHPMMLIGSSLQANPFFVPPEQFLRERGARAGGAVAS